MVVEDFGIKANAAPRHGRASRPSADHRKNAGGFTASSRNLRHFDTGALRCSDATLTRRGAVAGAIDGKCGPGEHWAGRFGPNGAGKTRFADRRAVSASDDGNGRRARRTAAADVHAAQRIVLSPPRRGSSRV
jgi:ABC-type molybdenum transport system ATPase subunit/photorepair protein PhrA